MKKKLMLSVLAASTVASAVASAAPIGLPAGPIFIQYNNAEQFAVNNDIPIPGGGTPQGAWGIVQISSIQQGTPFSPTGSDIGGGGPTLFTDGAGGQILGIFYGAHILSSGLGGTTAEFGVMDLYWWQGAPLQNVSAELASSSNLSKLTAQNQYTGFTCATGNTANCTLLAQLDFVPGSDPGVANVTFSTPVIPGTIDGTSKSYLSVDTSVVGAWTTALDTNFFTLDPLNNPVGFVYPGLVVSYPAAADVRLDSNFSANGGSAWSVAGTDIIGLRSNDPARGSIPEPGTVALVGLALAIAGGMARRRRSGEGSAV
jgi:hypothetical protein